VRRRHSCALSATLTLVLMFVPTLLSTPALATVVTCDDGAGEHLPAGDATTDLLVTGPCEVKAGLYTFHNVNIVKKSGADCAQQPANCGTLAFDDDPAGINFFAESILIENGGSLIAGSPAAPIGTKGGTVTIHLWGKQSDPGALCQTDERCGVDQSLWNSNPALTMESPPLNPADCTPSTEIPGVKSDCFYAYEALDEADMSAGRKAYFGHKVLALSFGGTLQLSGKKGATYSALGPSATGTSWVRLKGSLKKTAGSLTVDGVVDWQDKDHIVLTTTDYLPGHSEELEIHGTPSVSGNTTTINFINADGVTNGVKWPHNGQTFDLSTASYPGISRLNLNITSAETRAAVALLTRSIQIVSGGDTPNTSFPLEPTNGSVGYYFGGHTIVRQGFQTYQVQGVEFHQLGQGGSIMHYPVHFHLARQTPGAQGTTFVKDSSVWDSMTRWITIHGTQGVQLARNVGYKSIGHGYYLEDGTETNNQLYANIGIFARAAVANAQNKRLVPGILTTNDKACNGTNPPCAIGYDNFPYYSDANHPAVFWIMNGSNDFEYNMAAGAGTCGACYWLVPGAISGASRAEKWFGYASEQRSVVSPDFFERGGTTPLETFVGNSCTSAMNAFQEVGDTAVCNGVNFITQNESPFPVPLPPGSTLKMLPSQQATSHYPPNKGTDLYWPIVSGGGRLATRCPDADKGIATADCSTNQTAQICNTATKGNCDVTVLDRFTTAFNWAQKNFSAIWMRPFWSLVIDSVISDVQSAGLNFVTSGDYSRSSVIDGFWALARKSAFIGSTQWQNPNSDLSDNPLASNTGPFNPFKSKDGTVTGLACGPNPFGGAFNPSYCISQDEGISIQLEAFTNFQRMFSVYDGPAYQDSNAFLNIQPTYLTKDGTATGDIFPGCVAGACPVGAPGCNPCATVGFKDSFLSGVRADNLHKLCYLPNAAIGWKQSNGFYYAPAFHSTNLFFDIVGIRHFVTEPLFNSTSVFDFSTNLVATSQEYCQWANDFFNNFTDIDRETVLNDDDGTLTGLTSPVNQPTVAKTETISVNKEEFFDAPSETPECASDLPLNTNGPNQAGDAKCPPNTAKTSPYQYVTTALYPECALTAPPPNAQGLAVCTDGSWGSACSTQPIGDNILGCPGVPLYRQLLIANEKPGLNQVKRMMGQNTFQRSGLTVNNGVYYIDTTVSKATQTNPNGVKAKSINVFTAGQKYDVFFLYANKNTSQTFKLFVGKGIPNAPGTNRNFALTNVKFGYVDITTNKYTFALATPPGMNKNPGDLPDGWVPKYDSPSGILTVTTDMSTLADDFDFSKNNLGVERCQPATMCSWNTSVNQCQCDSASPYYNLCQQQNPAGQTICSWSVKDVDCPAQGCPAFQITFPAETYFKAMDQDADCLSAKPVTCVRPMPAAFNFGSSFNWNIGFNLENSAIAGQQCTYSQQPPLACAQ
jgi:hypothetical protein